MLTDLEIQTMRCDRDLLQRELEAAGVQFKGKLCKCPFHNDNHPSADLYQKDGVWRFHCFPCNKDGDIFDVRAWLNKSTVENELALEGMKRMQTAPKKPPTPTYPSLEAIVAKYKNVEAVYKYTDPVSGKVELAAIRYRGPDGKRFVQASPAPGAAWWEKGLERNPLYNRKRIAGVDTVVVVEGEKCVHALHDFGVIATTSPGGANGAKKADWTPLEGKRCILWADNDGPGVQYMRDVAKILGDMGCTVCQVDHEALELKEGGDAADFVARYGADVALGREAVLDVLADAKTTGISADYLMETEKIIGGQRRALPFAWPLITSLSRALMPGTVTCLFGPPGALKSYWIMECLVEWVGAGIDCCVFELEEDRVYHMRRAHAQMARDSRIMSNDWIEANAMEFRLSRDALAKHIEAVGKVITDAPNDEISFEMLTTWADSRAKQGKQIIVIDPVTAVTPGAKVWIEDQKFIFHMKTLARTYQTRIILVTHPRKAIKPGAIGLDDMAGGSSYQRFSQSVLLLERNKSKEAVEVRKDPAWPIEMMSPDLVLHIAKARNGPGAGKKIAVQLGRDTLRFKELGVLE